MREDYTFYNCYCCDNILIDFKAYALNELRKLNYFPWLRDEPRNLKDERDFLNATQRIPYLERGYISDNKKNIQRMEKQGEATHKLFESLKVFD